MNFAGATGRRLRRRERQSAAIASLWTPSATSHSGRRRIRLIRSSASETCQMSRMSSMSVRQFLGNKDQARRRLSGNEVLEVSGHRSHAVRHHNPS